jgi:hypothetical protein
MRLGGVSLKLVVAASVAVLVGCQSPANRVALSWLAQDCTVDGQGRLDAELRQQGSSAEPTLIRAFERGPEPAILDEVAAEAGSRYDEVASALAAGQAYGLTADEVASIRGISRADHVRRARESFERSYRAAALTGLGVLSLARGLDLLRRVAADPQSPNRAIAELALRRAGLAPASP